MPCLEQAGCLPMGIAGFSPLPLSRVRTGCRGAFEGPEVAGWRPGQGAGDWAARPEGSALSGCGPSSQTTDCARSLAPTPGFSVEPARAAPSHPPGTVGHLPALLGSRASGPRNLRSPGSRAAAPAPPAAAWRPRPTPRRSLRAAGSAARGDSRLGMLRSSHPDSAEEEERQGDDVASVMLLGWAKTYTPRRKEPVSEWKGGKKSQEEAGGKKTSGQ